MGETGISDTAQTKKQLYMSLFTVYVTVAVVFGSLIQLSGVLERQELQTINRRFETRPWLVWSQESLKRLNPITLWQYHEAHEIPRQWWAWDQTLSWLLENNHPRVINKIVIFNHLFEDEPPKEAVEAMPWMKPLLDYPVSRKTVADMVNFLCKAGALAIVLDCDFPQYSPDDKVLAQAIHDCASGKYGREVPVYMVRSVNRRSSGPILALEVPSAPDGILSELRKLEPGVDVIAKYTGMTSIDQDGDQVVRRIWTRRPSATGDDHEALVVKVLRHLGKRIPADLPDRMDIDFACPPNFHLYPVRPISYLLDPATKETLLQRSSSSDVDVSGAIVLIGDGISDVYSTPFTNEGLNLMSGTEILAHAMDTISRRSWPHRLDTMASLVYLLAAAMVGGVIWLQWKDLQQAGPPGVKNQRLASLLQLTADVLFYLLTLVSTYFVACVIFADSGLLVPVFVPSLALGLGTLAAIIWEREREKEDAFHLRLFAAQDKLGLEREKFESELARHNAEAQAREMLQDRKRRHEFVRRINHDLNAPVSVLNWTIAELQMMDLESPQAQDKVCRLVKSSDKLCELIDQLVQSYDYETIPSLDNSQAALCDLSAVVDDCVDGQKPLADKHDDTIEWQRPDHQLWTMANSIELSRVIDNLLRNAIKHNGRGTSIFVSAETSGTFHTVVIADSGNGIAAEHLSRIFDAGYRVHPDKGDGQGLGLDIAKTLVESMGGEISVASSVGKGTTFKLKLPVCSDERTTGQFQALKENDAAEADTLEEHPVVSEKTLETANQGTGE